MPLEELRTFADVYNQIRIGYVEEIDDSTLLEYAIKGMLMGLDPHSMYLTRGCLLRTCRTPPPGSSAGWAWKWVWKSGLRENHFRPSTAPPPRRRDCRAAT